MAAIYLYVNAALYAAFALWCTVAGSATSKATGYSVLTNSGESEYRVVYGGLQLGLAVIFAYLAARPTESQVGVMFAVTLYVPIVAYRMVTVMRYWPVSSTAIAVATMEVLLLAWGGGLLATAR